MNDYNFDRYAQELAEIMQLSARPGWSPARAARMYLEHAYHAGYGTAIEDALQHVQTVFTDSDPLEGTPWSRRP